MTHPIRWLLAASLLALAACAQQPALAPPPATTDASCAPITEAEVAALFDRWNASLASGRPDAVVANYAPVSILLPTLSNMPRRSAEEKRDYFEHFLTNQPRGTIDQRFVVLGCNFAVDAGLYTFTFAKTGASVRARYTYTYAFADGKWLITTHHSSAMPER